MCVEQRYLAFGATDGYSWTVSKKKQQVQPFGADKTGCQLQVSSCHSESPQRALLRERLSGNIFDFYIFKCCVLNEFFYQSQGEKMITYSAAEWEYLPRKGFPMIFHGVQGKEDTDQFSPRYAALSNICQALCMWFLKFVHSQLLQHLRSGWGCEVRREDPRFQVLWSKATTGWHWNCQSVQRPAEQNPQGFGEKETGWNQRWVRRGVPRTREKSDHYLDCPIWSTQASNWPQVQDWICQRA